MFLKVLRLKTIGIISINLPEYHPARACRTFFYSNQSRYFTAHAHLKVQVRYMENNKTTNTNNFSRKGFSYSYFISVTLYFSPGGRFVLTRMFLLPNKPLYFTKEMFGKSKIRPSYFPLQSQVPRFRYLWDQKQKPIIELLKEPVG
jgi:hypothetical protein